MDKTNRMLVPASPMPTPLAPAVIDDGFIKSRIHTIRDVPACPTSLDRS